MAIVLFIISELNSRKKKQAYNFEVLPMDMFVLKLVFISALIGCITWVLAGYQRSFLDGGDRAGCGGDL